ncbi:MAG: OB-fold nucleic acid binding domain-containing protein, partial [Clostridia bacterium]|nr:OB-fold nucleic acid binding domain-containing protein [Clostridia bacterium]
MKRTTLKEIFSDPKTFEGKKITVCGWAKTVRDSKSFGFIELNDGSYFKNCQVVFARDTVKNYDEVAKQNVGACMKVVGTLVLTPERNQPFEISAESVDVLGTSTPDYPLQKKRHTLEFLRGIPHLRPRTNTFNAVFKIRSEAAFAIHKFFNERGFVYVHTPIVTG